VKAVALDCCDFAPGPNACREREDGPGRLNVHGNDKSIFPCELEARALNAESVRSAGSSSTSAEVDMRFDAIAQERAYAWTVKVEDAVDHSCLLSPLSVLYSGEVRVMVHSVGADILVPSWLSAGMPARRSMPAGHVRPLGWQTAPTHGRMTDKISAHRAPPPRFYP